MDMPLVANKSKPKKVTRLSQTLPIVCCARAKEKMLREKGRIDYDQLRRDGFSAEMIARLKALCSYLAISARVHKLFG
jgi:hypothetical protein